MKVEPQRVCTIQVMQAISVRRRSTPRKQSRYEVPAEICFSIVSVWVIIAIVASALKVGSLRVVRRRRAFFASSVRP